MRLLRRLLVAPLLAAALVSSALGATTSPNRGYTVPTPFADTNIWGTMLQGDLNQLDQNLGGNCTVPISSPSTTATTQQLSCLVQKLTGVLSQNTTYTMPVPGGGFWIVDNETTGNFTLTILSPIVGGSGFAVPQGAHTLVYTDGTNFFQVAAAGLQPSGNVGGDLGGSLPNPTVTNTHLTNPLPSNQGGVPAGTVFYYAGGPSPPSGYLIGDGSAQSRASFPTLNSLLSSVGYPYGAGDGSSTFNIPDCRARYIAGGDASNSTGRLTGGNGGGISASALGNTGGAQVHTLVIGEIPSHNHSISLGFSDPGHSHTIQNGTGSGGLAGGGTNNPPAGTSTNTTGITFSPSIGNTGGGGSHDIIPPSIILNCIIRAF